MSLGNTLPAQLTSFVGEGDHERATVAALLTGRRLMTLAGAGGCGKTRLAVQATSDQAAHWPAGVWWVDLGGLADSALVTELVAAVMGVLVEPVQGPTRSLTVQLRERRALVCLDNCEHVLDGAAEVTDALLRSCPELAVLTTSREPLRVPETVWRVPPLAEDEALALFVERASLVLQGEFTLDALRSVAAGGSVEPGEVLAVLERARGDRVPAACSPPCAG